MQDQISSFQRQHNSLYMEGMHVQFLMGINNPTGPEANFVKFKKLRSKSRRSMAK